MGKPNFHPESSNVHNLLYSSKCLTSFVPSSILLIPQFALCISTSLFTILWAYLFINASTVDLFVFKSCNSIVFLYKSLSLNLSIVISCWLFKSTFLRSFSNELIVWSIFCTIHSNSSTICLDNLDFFLILKFHVSYSSIKSYVFEAFQNSLSNATSILKNSQITGIFAKTQISWPDNCSVAYFKLQLWIFVINWLIITNCSDFGFFLKTFLRLTGSFTHKSLSTSFIDPWSICLVSIFIHITWIETRVHQLKA